MSHYRIPKQVEMRPSRNDTSAPGLSDFTEIVRLTARQRSILAGVIQCEDEEFNQAVGMSKVIQKQIREAKTKLKDRQKWRKYQ